MGKFTVIPQDTFESLQLDAGVLLNKFNPANPVAPTTGEYVDFTCDIDGTLTFYFALWYNGNIKIK